MINLRFCEPDKGAETAWEQGEEKALQAPKALPLSLPREGEAMEGASLAESFLIPLPLLHRCGSFALLRARGPSREFCESDLGAAPHYAPSCGSCAAGVEEEEGLAISPETVPTGVKSMGSE